MKKALLVGGVAAVIVAVSGVAVAQSVQQSGERPQARGLRADADGDQRLSQAEFVGARVDRLAAADTNGDGSVTPEERRAVALARRDQRAEARFDRLDADDDGVISKAEFDARRDARAERGGRPGRAHRAGTRGPVVIADARARAEAAFTRLDSDRDGFITGAERQAVRADRRQQRHERMMERRAARRAQQPSPSAPASE